MNTPLIVKSLAFVYTSNGFVKFGNFNTWVNKIFYFKSSNVLYLFLLPFEGQFLLKEIQSGFINYKEFFLNFQQKLPSLGKILHLGTTIGLLQSLMACNFLRSSLTPSHDKICLKKSISFQANSFFVLLAKSLFSQCLFKTYFKYFACFSVILE